MTSSPPTPPSSPPLSSPSSSFKKRGQFQGYKFSRDDKTFLATVSIFFFFMGPFQVTALTSINYGLPLIQLFDNYVSYVALIFISFAGYKFLYCGQLMLIIEDVLTAYDKLRKKDRTN